MSQYSTFVVFTHRASFGDSTCTWIFNSIATIENSVVCVVLKEPTWPSLMAVRFIMYIYHVHYHVSCTVSCTFCQMVMRGSRQHHTLSLSLPLVLYLLFICSADCQVNCLSLDRKSCLENILLVIYFSKRVSCEPLELLVGIISPMVLRGRVLRAAWGIFAPAFLWVVNFGFFLHPLWKWISLDTLGKPK